MDMLNAEFKATVEQYRTLTKRQVNKEDVKKYIKRVFPSTAKDADDEASATEEAVTRLFETGRGADMPGVAGTAWGLYNAANEYLNYEAGRTADNRINSLWFGQGATTNDKALQYAYQLVA